MARVERARPWLGTIATIRADGRDDTHVVAAIERAFAAIAHVHRRMSFQSADSDLAAIARLGPGEGTTIDPATAVCLAHALQLACESGGAFDPVLPAGGASWRDLRLDGLHVTTRVPLRLDLSGIAKGYAVDQACDVLAESDIAVATVNAGGDLRTFGAEQMITLTPHTPAPAVAILVADGALASSDVVGSRAQYGTACHRDGRTGTSVPAAFASVAAPRCIDADALTKVVLAMGADAVDLLYRRKAVAYVHRADDGWRTIGKESWT